MHATFIGGSLHGQTQELPDTLNDYRVLVADDVVQYERQLYVTGRGLTEHVFFVFPNLSEQQKIDLIEKHLRHSPL